ncbi:MAG: DNA gyrase inhibitor YacG [Acidocella sp. 35-58-6]|nr:MAG: DNA gyrase inhibitor YacG [Acidocella sp. 35-58-6]
MSQCPICNKPTDPAHKPFCSKRCADVDLGRWLTESYSLPAKPAIEEEEEAE